MSELVVYIPSDSPTDTESVAYVRQNAWKKTEEFLSIVEKTKTIHLPHAHSKKDVEDYEKNGQINDKYAKMVAEIPIGSVVLIPNGTHGLLVRIDSPVKTGILKDVCIAANPKTCSHRNTHGTKDCQQCSNAVVKIFRSDSVSNIQQHLKQGHQIEPFWCLYRSCESIGKVDYNGQDGRSFGGMDSVGLWKRFWKRKE